jgi:hypothetical protein
MQDDSIEQDGSGLVDEGVIKRHLKKEIERLEETRLTLTRQENHNGAHDVSQQKIGVQAFWATLRMNGIAL